MNAVGYARISDKDQSHNSIEDQQIRINEYCQRNNIQLEKIFTEKGKSAFTFDRPEWKNLEAYLKKNKQVKFLIVKHIDRFSRAELLDALIKIDEIENKFKVKIVSIEDPINQNSSDLGVQLMRTIKLLMSNNELNRIKERTNDGIYRSLSNGRFCNHAPYGYKNSRDPEGKPLLIIDNQRAPVIRKIFKWYNEGKEITEVKKLAYDAGLKRKGSSVIQEILDQPVYAGLIKLPAYKGNPEKMVKAIHAPIVSEHDYWTAQQRLHKKNNKVQKRDDVPLRGILQCHCGKLMTAGNSKGRTEYYWYYLCPDHKKNLPAKKLHEQLYKILDELSLKDDQLEWYRKMMSDSIENRYQNRGGTIMRTKLDLQKIQKKLESTQTKYLLEHENIDANIYAKVVTDLKQQESELHNKLNELTLDVETYYNTVNEVLPQLKNLRENFITWPLHQKQLFIITLFHRPVQYIDGSYRTTYIDPMFADKALILKEKGLLNVEQSSSKSDVSPLRAGERSLIESLLNWKDVFAA
jgi:site-specific DNA recombinase